MNLLQRMQRTLLLLWALFVPWTVWAADNAQVFRVGVTAFRDKSATQAEWQPTMDFLQDRIPGTRFEVVPLTLPEFEGALKVQSLDFLITNPQHYIAVEAQYAVSRIATLVKRENDQIVNRFGGVIFTMADRAEIQELSDLKGKRVAATDQTSFAAYLIQYDLLLEHGVNLQKDCQVQYLGFPQDLSVLAVLNGKADVGFARSGVLEAMASEGKLDLSRLKVLHRQHAADFPFLVSSALFPEWPLAAAPHVSFDIANQVVASLLLMPPDALAAKRGRYFRWSTPVEYQSVQALMKRRHVYPFDKAEPFAPREVLREYAVPVVLVVGGVALSLALLTLRAYRLNAQLTQSRQTLAKLAHHDALTGLPNRNLLDERLERAIAQSRREVHAVALCMLDLDGFKPINDHFGHDTGDRVLQDVAHRIKAVLRDADTVARFGGDEFVLLLNGFGDDHALGEVMARVIATVAQSFDYCPGAHVTASIGVSVLGADASDATTLLRHADEAMYLAKGAGGNRYVKHAA